jgi:hypothetical protein
MFWKSVFVLGHFVSIMTISYSYNFAHWFLSKPVPSPKNIITISPSGLSGYYLLGIASYLKDNYNLDNYVFSGASAGAWISLLMTYKGRNQELIQDVLDTSEKCKRDIKTLGRGLRDMLLKSGRYCTRDFDLRRCYMGLIDIKHCQEKNGLNLGLGMPKFQIDKIFMEAQTMVYHNFPTLEDAVHCCIASSHVPFLMGDIFRRYRNRNTIDGGFDSKPYHGEGHIDGNCAESGAEGAECQLVEESGERTLHIHPFIWVTRPVSLIEYFANQLRLFLTLFVMSSISLKKLYYDGYEAARRRKDYFDIIFQGSK